MIRFMIGEVKEVTEDHTITFNLSDWAEEIGSPPPSATPLTKLTRFPQEGDEVFILQPDSKFEIFFYTLTPDDRFDISLNYGLAYVRIYKQDDKYIIKADDSQKTTFTMTENQSMLEVAGSANVSVTNKGVSINGDGGIVEISNGSVSIRSSSDGSVISMTNSDVTINNHLKVTK